MKIPENKDNNTVNEENKKSENDIPNVEKDTIDSYDASEVIVNNQKYKDPILKNTPILWLFIVLILI